jgi:cytoskeletal protein CcmA (bactofilin family)
MPVGPPNWWLLNRMVQLTNNTLETIVKSDIRVLGNILNNDNTITGNNSFTGNNIFTGDNTFEGNGDFTTLKAGYIESRLIQSQSVRLNTINYSPLVYEVPWLSNDINGTFIITYNNDTLQLTINNPEVYPATIKPSEYLVDLIGIDDINEVVGLTITLTSYTNSSIAEESNPLSTTFTIIDINTDVDYILEIQLDSSLPNTTYNYGDHTFEGTIILTAVINSNEIGVNTNLNLSDYKISANLGNFTNVVIDGNLSGNTQLNIQGNLVITGETTFNGNINSNNTLNIESNVSINNSLTVNDASTFNETLNIKNGGITLGNLSTFNDKVIFNGNVIFAGNVTETPRETLVIDANKLVLNANMGLSDLDFTHPAGIVVETHDEINHPHGYLFFDLSADRFWDLSGDNLSGNILQAKYITS